MTEIFEIDKSAIYKIGRLQLKGNELINTLANGLKYEELSERLEMDGVNHEG